MTKQNRGQKQRDRYVEEALQRSRAIDGRRLVVLFRDRLEAGQIQDGEERNAPPDADGDEGGQRRLFGRKPVDAADPEEL